ncbi:MAG: CBS domain-containing protein [Bacteroidota bacterium]
MKEFREKLGLIVIIISVIILGLVGAIIIWKDSSKAQFVYTSLLPMVGTWVGVVLAFYFGKENYEAASKGLENIINKLTPDVLDDIPVSQIMISRKTMVAKKWDDIRNKTVKETQDFLLENEKTRLPLLDNEGRVIYIVHSSLMSKPKKNENDEVEVMDTSKTMEEFISDNKEIVGKIHWVKENDIIENVQKIMKDDTNCKDVFVENESDQLVGWVTDTLILRFIGAKKN